MKIKTAFAALLAGILITGCTEGAEVQKANAAVTSETEAAEPETEAPEVYLEMQTQDYKGDFIVEIPRIAGGSNEAVGEINEALDALKERYKAFGKDGRQYLWIECKTYPTTTERYINIVMTWIEFPNYGTDGEVFSFNYDRETGKSVTLEEAMEERGVTVGMLEAALNETMAEGIPVSGVAPAAFRLYGDSIDVYFTADVDFASHGAPWRTIYTYSGKDGKAREYNNFVLGNPHELDKMEPPLYYGQNIDHFEYTDTYSDEENHVVLSFPREFFVGTVSAEKIYETADGSASLSYIPEGNLRLSDFRDRLRKESGSIISEDESRVIASYIKEGRGHIENIFLLNGRIFRVILEFPADKMEEYLSLNGYVSLR